MFKYLLAAMAGFVVAGPLCAAGFIIVLFAVTSVNTPKR